MDILLLFSPLISIIAVYIYACTKNKKLIRTLPYLVMRCFITMALLIDGILGSKSIYDNYYKWFQIIRDIVYGIVSVAMFALSIKMSRNNKKITSRVLYCSSVLLVNLLLAYVGRIHWL